jgi:hypothetical protein
MKVITAVAACALVAVFVAACGSSSPTSQGVVAQIACLDVNHDGVVNDGDAAMASTLPDFTHDGKHDQADAAFVAGVDIPLDPKRDLSQCKSVSGTEPEYMVADGVMDPSSVTCDGGAKPVLVVGVGGGVVNVRKSSDAAGVRSIVNGLLQKYDDKNVPTIAVIAGPAIGGAQQIHSAMEQWMTHAVQVYLDRYPCMRAVLIGHSHGADTADVVSAHLEGKYASRIIEDVDIDRTTDLYTGDTQSRPTQVHVLNIYESNSGALNGAPYNSSNAENWDASDVQAPEHGDNGGSLKKVDHTTIDNSAAVKDRIIADVIGRS